MTLTRRTGLRRPLQRLADLPHLQSETNFSVTADEKKQFAAAAIRHFSEIMDAGTDHIAVTLRCLAPEDLTFGRAASRRSGSAA